MIKNIFPTMNKTLVLRSFRWKLLWRMISTNIQLFLTYLQLVCQWSVMFVWSLSFHLILTLCLKYKPISYTSPPSAGSNKKFQNLTQIFLVPYLSHTLWWFHPFLIFKNYVFFVLIPPFEISLCFVWSLWSSGFSNRYTLSFQLTIL